LKLRRRQQYSDGNSAARSLEADLETPTKAKASTPTAALLKATPTAATAMTSHQETVGAIVLLVVLLLLVLLAIIARLSRRPFFLSTQTSKVAERIQLSAPTKTFDSATTKHSLSSSGSSG